MSTELQITLNACKKCGSDAVEHEQMALPGTGSHAEFIVACSCCNQKGDWCLTKFDAAVSWNTKNRIRT
jgi:hypothetical protein